MNAIIPNISWLDGASRHRVIQRMSLLCCAPTRHQCDADAGPATNAHSTQKVADCVARGRNARGAFWRRVASRSSITVERRALSALPWTCDRARRIFFSALSRFSFVPRFRRAARSLLPTFRCAERKSRVRPRFFLPLSISLLRNHLS